MEHPPHQSLSHGDRLVVVFLSEPGDNQEVHLSGVPQLGGGLDAILEIKVVSSCPVSASSQTPARRAALGTSLTSSNKMPFTRTASRVVGMPDEADKDYEQDESSE